MSKQCTVALNCYATEVSAHSTQGSCAWHLAETRFVTLLSTKMLTCLEICHGVPEKRLSCSTT